MSYLSMTEYETAPSEVRAQFDYQIAKNGRITNMKRTLLNDLPSYETYMKWYDLFDAIEPFTGRRPLDLFCYAISQGNSCLVCSTFFRQILIDSGDDPDNPQLSEIEELLMDFGHAIVLDPNNIPSTIYEGLKEHFSETQIVQLIAFAGIMYATNLFNMVAKVPLDEVLYAYQKPDPVDAQ